MKYRQRQDQQRRFVPLSVPPFFRLCCVFSAIVFLPFFWYHRLTFSSPRDGDGLSKKIDFFSKGSNSNKHRLAIIIPFIGEGPEAVPPYLELFCTAAAGSSAIADFLLFHNGVLDGYHGEPCPSNVIFISLSNTEEFSKHLVRVVDHKQEEEIAIGQSKERLAKILAMHILKYPYVLVEFKPALGHIFADYLVGYSHWGYSDLDILFGDLQRWISPDELNDFDIVTYGFGDQNRIYLRGQFTFHRNNERVNNIFRRCTYLSDMDKRFNDVLSGEKHLHFESAEGCYSAAVLEQPDLSIKYAVKAFTDIHEEDTAYSHGMYVSTGKKKNKTILYKASSSSGGKALEKLSDTWFETKGSIYADPKKPLIYEIGERERIPLIENTNSKCMFWAQKEYQSRLCLDGVESTETVFWINGQLYKQQYQLAELPGKILSAPFFHFQEYKRHYRTTQLTGFHRDGPVRSFVLTKEGVLPIFPEEFKVDKNFVPSPLALKLQKWNGVDSDDRQHLPKKSYCLRSGPRKFPPMPKVPQCQMILSWSDKDAVEILSGAPSWNEVDAQSEVTLALTLQLLPSQVSSIEALHESIEIIGTYLDRWQGQPSVLILHVPSASAEAIEAIRSKFGPQSDLGLDTCFVAAIFTISTDVISRKALLNMAIDMVPTRWYIVGFELERGLVISQDAAFLAHRISGICEDLSGSVFILPQFGSLDQLSDNTLSALWLAKDEDKLRDLETLDQGECDDRSDSAASDLMKSLTNIWWKRSEIYLKESTGEVMDDEGHEQRAKALYDIYLETVALLTDTRQLSLFSMDISPIMLIDNIGPRNGMQTSEISREVEEFAGMQCYNALRLAQLATLGYRIDVLAGAFAISTPSTRDAMMAGTQDEDLPFGASRCDTCFLFDENNEQILEDISRDERKRPAKAVILWDQNLNSNPSFIHP